MCLYPKLIKNRKYIPNKKNGGVIPALSDKRVLWVPVGCGKCMECKKQKANSWRVRLLEDVRHEKNGIFVTLTFNNESIKELSEDITVTGYERDNAIAKKAMRRFLERWRKKYKKSVRHFMVTELGHNGTENIHMHGIIWTNENREEIRNIWKYGYVWIPEKGKGWVNEQTVNYITKYITKTDIKHKEYEPKILTSAGIGKGYIKRIDAQNNKYKGKETEETYKNRQGYKMSLPIYYRNKIYTDEEKEKLWIIKLDKNERWVDGIKINTENTEEIYYKVLEEARKKNQRLGYGDNKINWERKKYENELRNINYKKRINKINKTPAEGETIQPKQVGKTPTYVAESFFNHIINYEEMKQNTENIW